MKKILTICVASLFLSGCSTIAGLFPRDHDPVAFDRLVVLSIQVNEIDCEQPNWQSAVQNSKILALSSEWRSDPQTENLNGLHAHLVRMNSGGSKTFCELGKRTASGRITAAKTAWESR
jgi:hypothetical protein